MMDIVIPIIMSLGCPAFVIGVIWLANQLHPPTPPIHAHDMREQWMWEKWSGPHEIEKIDPNGPTNEHAADFEMSEWKRRKVE
jgi:hypothetical protein